MTQAILDKGYHESNGSVYFDVNAYNNDGDYGVLRRKMDELASRALDGQMKSVTCDLRFGKGLSSTYHAMAFTLGRWIPDGTSNVLDEHQHRR